jgi:hypothetical protein
MQNETKVPKPTFIYKIFDSIIANSDFFSLPRLEAFLHSFRILEGMQNNLGLGNKELDTLLASSRFFEDSKKYLINWIYYKCPEGGKLIKTKESDIEKSIQAISLAHKFSIIHDAIVSVQKHWADFYLDNKKNLIKFRYRDKEKGVLLSGKFFDKVRREAKNINRIEKIMRNAKALFEAFAQFSETIHITKEKELRFQTNEFILDYFEKYVRETLNLQAILEDSWSLGTYSIGDFRETWIQINKLNLIHMFAFLRSYQKYGNYDTGFNNALFRIRKKNLIKYITKHTRLNELVISEIIRDLTYDYTIPHMDIIYQPLIEINNNEIFSSPLLIIGSMIDRNFQALLTKLPHRKREYDRLKNSKEDKMIEDLTPFLKKFGFKFESRIILKENKQIKTDIDLLIWDDTYKDFLVIELKWFYGPDSTQELFNHDQQFNKGIRKTKNCIDFLERNKDSFFQKLDIPNTRNNKNIYGLILSKMGTTSPFIDDPDFPVIEEMDFLVMLEKGKARVSILYKMIISFLDIKKSTRSLKTSSSELSVGDYTFILPAIEY